MKGVIIHAYSNVNVFILNLGCIYDIDVPLDTTEVIGTTFCFFGVVAKYFCGRKYHTKHCIMWILACVVWCYLPSVLIRTDCYMDRTFHFNEYANDIKRKCVIPYDKNTPNEMLCYEINFSCLITTEDIYIYIYIYIYYAVAHTLMFPLNSMPICLIFNANMSVAYSGCHKFGTTKW